MAAVQALYQMELSGSSTETAVEDVAAGRLPAGDAGGVDGDIDQALFRKIIEAVVNEQGAIDTEIARSLSEGWKLERIDSVARAILRAATVELWRDDAPTAVVIDEYVAIANDFFGGPEPGFINAALDASAKRLRGSARHGAA
jgi:N utilization substance protein B